MNGIYFGHKDSGRGWYPIHPPHIYSDFQWSAPSPVLILLILVYVRCIGNDSPETQQSIPFHGGQNIHPQLSSGIDQPLQPIKWCHVLRQQWQFMFQTRLFCTTILLAKVWAQVSGVVGEWAWRETWTPFSISRYSFIYRWSAVNILLNSPRGVGVCFEVK